MEKPNMVRCVNCGAYNQYDMYSCGTCNGTEFEQLESQTRLDRECRNLRAVNAELVQALEECRWLMNFTDPLSAKAFMRSNDAIARARG